jgi:hypothetical protein
LFPQWSLMVTQRLSLQQICRSLLQLQTIAWKIELPCEQMTSVRWRVVWFIVLTLLNVDAKTGASLICSVSVYIPRFCFCKLIANQL